MDITPVGYILIPLGIALFFRGARYLFWAVMVSLPLFDVYIATSWLTVLRPPHYFAVLLIIRKFIDGSAHHYFGFRLNRENMYLLLFLAVAIASLIMPILAAGKVQVFPIDTSVGLLERLSPETLQLRRQNFTQIIYILFFAASFFAFVSEIRSTRMVILVTKGLVYSSVVVILIGFIYQALVITGNINIFVKISYFLRGTEVGIYGKHGMSLFNFAPQMYSTAGEPGLTAFYCLTGLGILSTFAISQQRAVFGNRVKVIALFMFLVLGILSTGSSTGYYGLVILVLAVIFIALLRSGLSSVFIKQTFRVSMIFFLIFVGVLGLVKLLTNDSFLNYVVQDHIEVVTQGTRSGELRAYLAFKNFDLFLHYPLLGVGYGSTRSLSMSTFLLANVGLLGAMTFYLFNFSIFKKGYIVIRSNVPPYINITVQGLLTAFIVVFALMQFAQSESAMLCMHYWVLLAVLARYEMFIYRRRLS